MNFYDIDWNKMWQESRKKKSWRTKKNTVWDRRAESFAQRNMTSPFVDRFLELIHPEANMTVLDIGSGPGTLAVPLANNVKQVTAVDFSENMLTILREAATRQHLDNITTICGAWEDDWHALGIKPHEVLIASRSLSVDDLQGALRKLDQWSTKSVFIADRVGAGPFDPDLFLAIGRSFEPGPDYIFTLNLLYQMGIHARVDFISLGQPKLYASEQDALESCMWMFEDLTDEEMTLLKKHVHSRLEKMPDGRLQMSKKQPTKWAIISWTKNQSHL